MKPDQAINVWLIFDKPQGYQKRYVARRWVHKGDQLSPTSAEVQTDDIEFLRSSFLAEGLHIMPKGFGKLIDIWVEPEGKHVNLDRLKAVF